MKFYVDKQTIRPDGIQPSVASDSIDFVTCYFRFGPLWAGMTITAQFTQNGKIIHQLLDDGWCTLPSELTAGSVALMLFGQEPGGTVRATTGSINIPIIDSGFDGNGETPVPPTPDLYAQLLAQIDAGGGGGTAVNWGDGLCYNRQTNTVTVDTANIVEKDNTKPVTSAAVYTEIGNINAILATI